MNLRHHNPLPAFKTWRASLRLQNSTLQLARFMTHDATRPVVPSPTPFVPNLETFLTLIGRNSIAHLEKLQSWENFFKIDSKKMAQLGIGPAKHRRYLLRWAERFRQGQHGIYGELTDVVDGVAELRIVEVPASTVKRAPGSASSEHGGVTATATSSPGMAKMVVNTKPGASKPSTPLAWKHIRKVGIANGQAIRGPFLEYVEGSHGTAARVRVRDGMWAPGDPKKVDGGERRRAEVRAKRRVQERKMAGAGR